MSGLASLINWSQPVQVKTKYGLKWKRSWVITHYLLEGFFIFWNNKKDVLKQIGYGISKNGNGRWCLDEWQERKTDFNEKFGELKPKYVIDIKDIPTKCTLPEYKMKDVSGLIDYQIPVTSQLCSALITNGSAIDGSSTGSGKSYVATAAARELGLKIGVVCPKSVISSWVKVITKHFKMKPQFVLNYESVKTGKFKEIGVWKPVSRDSNREFFEWSVPKDTLIIFDESHRLKGQGTLNAEIALAAHKQKYKILCASATNAISPTELKCTGKILGVYRSSFTQFLRDHDCEKGRFGWQFNGDPIVLKKLHADLFLKRGVRIKTEDIPGFPDCEIIAEAYNIDEKSEKELKEVYKEMHRELDMLRIKCKNQAEWKINSLVIQIRGRQKAELLKIPLFVEMVEDALEDGMSVAVFLNFTESIKALSERLKTKCIVWGANKKTEREDNVEAFQSDEERVILVNVAAGGVGIGLHDLHGKYPRLALISPHPSAVTLKQCLGRIHRQGALTKSLQKIVFTANCEEEDICEKLKLKLNNLDLINDGDLSNNPIFEKM
jgi:superfamily II DNA or RNA helicase